MPALWAAVFWPGAKPNNARMATRAVIDIGTNSVKLLVAEVRDGEVDPLFEKGEQTRLGAGFYETHLLRADAIAATAEAVADFTERARQFGAVSIDVIATSAAREATNARELIDAVESASGLPLRVISGDQEADWAFCGVATQRELQDQPLLVMDIGGGSTEFVLGARAQRKTGRSFQLGSVRLLEKITPSDPPTDEQRERCLTWLRDFFSTEVSPFLAEHLHETRPLLITTGGTGTILGRIKHRLTHYDREIIEGSCISAKELAEIVRRLWSLPLEERKQIPGLPASRADVIIMGAAILEAATEALRFDEVHISTRGLRFGAVLHAEKSAAT